MEQEVIEQTNSSCAQCESQAVDLDEINPISLERNRYQEISHQRNVLRDDSEPGPTLEQVLLSIGNSAENQLSNEVFKPDILINEEHISINEKTIIHGNQNENEEVSEVEFKRIQELPESIEKLKKQYFKLRELVDTILSNQPLCSFLSHEDLSKLSKVKDELSRILANEISENELAEELRSVQVEFDDLQHLEEQILSILESAKIAQIEDIAQLENELVTRISEEPNLGLNSNANNIGQGNPNNHSNSQEVEIKESIRVRFLKGIVSLQVAILEYFRDPVNIIRCLQLAVSILFVSALVSIPDMQDQQVGYIFDWLAFNKGSNLLIWTGTVCYCCSGFLCVRWVWVRIIGSISYEEGKKVLELFLEQNPVLQLSIVYMTDPKIIPNKLDQCIWAWIFFTFALLKVFTLLGSARMKLILETINSPDCSNEVKSIKNIERFCKIILLSTVYTCGSCVFLFQNIGTYRMILLTFSGLLGIIESLKTIACTSSLKRHVKFYTDANTEQIHDPFFLRETFFDTFVHVAQFVNSVQLIYNYIFKLNYEAIMHLWLLFLIKSIQASVRSIRHNFIAYRRFRWIQSHLDAMFPRVADADLLEGDVCSICHDDLLIARKIMSCGHRYHIKCLFNWLTSQQNSRCPICRAPIPNLNFNAVEYPAFFQSALATLSRIQQRMLQFFGIQVQEEQQQAAATIVAGEEGSEPQIPIQPPMNSNIVNQNIQIRGDNSAVNLNPSDHNYSTHSTAWGNLLRRNQMGSMSNMQSEGFGTQNQASMMGVSAQNGEEDEDQYEMEEGEEDDCDDEEGDYYQEDSEQFTQLQNWLSMSAGFNVQPQRSEQSLLNLRNELMSLQNILAYSGPTEAAVSLLRTFQQKLEIEQHSLISCLVNRFASQQSSEQLQSQEKHQLGGPIIQTNHNLNNIQVSNNEGIHEEREQIDCQQSQDVPAVGHLDIQEQQLHQYHFEQLIDNNGLVQHEIQSQVEDQFQQPIIPTLSEMEANQKLFDVNQVVNNRDQLDSISEQMINSFVESDDEFN